MQAVASEAEAEADSDPDSALAFAFAFAFVAVAVAVVVVVAVAVRRAERESAVHKVIACTVGAVEGRAGAASHEWVWRTADTWHEQGKGPHSAACAVGSGFVCASKRRRTEQSQQPLRGEGRSGAAPEAQAPGIDSTQDAAKHLITPHKSKQMSGRGRGMTKGRKDEYCASSNPERLRPIAWLHLHNTQKSE